MRVKPKSAEYFFWTGTSTIKTAVNDWSEKMRQLYVEAGIEGKRTHEWRDTLAIEVLEGGGSLEDVQLLLGHKSRKTIEKYYVVLTKKRMEKAIDVRRRTWDADASSSPRRRDGQKHPFGNNRGLHSATIQGKKP